MVGLGPGGGGAGPRALWCTPSFYQLHLSIFLLPSCCASRTPPAWVTTHVCLALPPRAAGVAAARGGGALRVHGASGWVGVRARGRAGVCGCMGAGYEGSAERQKATSHWALCTWLAYDDEMLTCKRTSAVCVNGRVGCMWRVMLLALASAHSAYTFRPIVGGRCPRHGMFTSSFLLGFVCCASPPPGAAIKVFESLEQWDYLITCYRLLGKKSMADQLIRRRCGVRGRLPGPVLPVIPYWPLARSSLPEATLIRVLPRVR